MTLTQRQLACWLPDKTLNPFHPSAMSAMDLRSEAQIALHRRDPELCRQAKEAAEAYADLDPWAENEGIDWGDRPKPVPKRKRPPQLDTVPTDQATLLTREGGLSARNRIELARKMAADQAREKYLARTMGNPHNDERRPLTVEEMANRALEEHERAEKREKEWAEMLATKLRGSED